jgi:hypothetical protein
MERPIEHPRLTKLWRKRVADALENYRRIAEVTSMLQAEDLPRSPERVRALRKAALRAEAAALAGYTRVPELFSDLVLHGKTPPED